MNDQQEDHETRLRRLAIAIHEAGLRDLIEEMAPLDYLLGTRSPVVRQGLSEGGYAWSVYNDLKRLCREIAAAVRADDEDIGALAEWLTSHAHEVVREVLDDWKPYKRGDRG